MTLPGGPANKLGNRYEKWWTVSEFVRMLHGSTEAIRIEDPGVEKTEFVVMAGSRRELHQVKRSHPSGKWSLAALGADGLLQTVGEELAGNNDRFVFASGSEARELSDLCEAARAAESAEEFEAHLSRGRGSEGIVQEADFATGRATCRLRLSACGGSKSERLASVISKKRCDGGWKRSLSRIRGRCCRNS